MELSLNEHSMNSPSDTTEADPRMRGLVIDDNESMRILLSRMLAAIGFDVQSISSSEGLQKLAGGDSTPARLNLPQGAGLILFGGGAHSNRQYAQELIMRNLERHLRSLAPVNPGFNVEGEERWTYDAARWTLIAPAGFRAQLSLAESQVVRCLLSRCGIVTTRDELLTALSRPHEESERRNLDVTISRLRKKIEVLCRRKLPLSSARGRGYIFNASAVVIG